MMTKMTKCDKCYKRVDEEHIIVPIRDISFLVLNCQFAYSILQSKGMEFTEHELKVMEKLWNNYAPIIHYNSSGRFYDMTDEEQENFKFMHKSYM